MKVKIIEGSCLARIAAMKLGSRKVAMVLGNRILLYNTSRGEFLSNKTWVLHELKHVEQYQRAGFVTFILGYLVESMRKGYRANKYELEARAAEHDESLLLRYELE